MLDENFSIHGWWHFGRAVLTVVVVVVVVAVVVVVVAMAIGLQGPEASQLEGHNVSDSSVNVFPNEILYRGKAFHEVAAEGPTSSFARLHSKESAGLAERELQAGRAGL